MREPDWQSGDGAVQLYCGDCLEILPEIPDGSVDAVVTDPPWGLGGSSGTIGKKRAKAVYDNGLVDDIEAVRQVYVPATRRAIAIAGRGAVTPGQPNAFEYDKPTDIGAIIQPCAAGLGKWGRATWQPVLFYGRDPRLGLTIQPTVFRNTEAPERCGHPCPKPTRVVCWLVDRASLAGEAVLDPFMGSGTTGVACIKLGRKFIGIEIYREYFDIAVRRCEDEFAKEGLFTGATSS